MKRNLLLTFIGFLTSSWLAFAQSQILPTDYVTTWKTDNNGISAPNQIEIPASGEYTVYYESIPAGMSGKLPATGTFTDAQTITLPAAGTYRIAIRPTGTTPFHRITFNGMSDALELLTIEQWGEVNWSSMEGAYSSCRALSAISAIDAPNLASVTSMANAFSSCSSLSSAPNIGNWDVSKVANMQNLFTYAVNFNEPIGSWNVSAVTNMQSMFEGALRFNQPIGSWNVSAVTNMAAMFYGAGEFNQPIGNWDVSKVTNMNAMLRSMNKFNQPIGNWDVSKVTNMGFMFAGTSAFNQPIESWDVSNVTQMPQMFWGAAAFNQPLESWDVSKVTILVSMFTYAGAFNQSLGKWSLNASVLIGNMLVDSGMDCNNYSMTLIGWAGNTSTPANRSLVATGRSYGTPAATAHQILVGKGWTISGDALDPNCSVLPVKLVYFQAKGLSDQTVELKWQTAQETANERFVVERSRDLVSFEKVTEILDVAGNSNVLRTYRAFDPIPYSGTSYYRLLQYDRDGTRTASRAVSVIVRSQDYVVYPNPTKTQPFHISVDEPITADVRIYSASGRAIAFMRGTDSRQNILIIPSEPLAPGVYLVLVRERAILRTHNLIVE